MNHIEFANNICMLVIMICDRMTSTVNASTIKEWMATIYKHCWTIDTLDKYLSMYYNNMN